MAFSTRYARAISRCKWLVLLFWAGLTLLGYKYGKEGFLSPRHDQRLPAAARRRRRRRDARAREVLPDLRGAPVSAPRASPVLSRALKRRPSLSPRRAARRTLLPLAAAASADFPIFDDATGALDHRVRRRARRAPAARSSLPLARSRRPLSAPPPSLLPPAPQLVNFSRQLHCEIDGAPAAACGGVDVKFPPDAAGNGSFVSACSRAGSRVDGARTLDHRRARFASRPRTARRS